MFIGRQWNAWEPTGWVGTECVVVFIGSQLVDYLHGLLFIGRGVA